jgi:hypothetical protein
VLTFKRDDHTEIMNPSALRFKHLILATRNTPVSSVNNLRDLNGDGKVDALDSRILTTLCMRSRCAVQ